MNRAKLLRLATRLANSVPNSVNSTQVTHFSHLTQIPHVSRTRKPLTYNGNSLFTHQFMFFSSKPESLVNLVLSNDWSKEIENELGKMNPNLTHELVVYVLMKLNKDPQKVLDFFKWVCDKKGFKPSSVIYGIVLRGLAGTEFMGQFWDIATEMKGKGFSFDRDTYLAVHGVLKREKLDKEMVAFTEMYKRMNEADGGKRASKKVAEVILGCDWGEELEGKLKKMKFPLSESLLVSVFRELKVQPMKALKFFEWIGSSYEYKHNAITYNAIVRVLAQDESMGEFWDMVERLRSEGYEVDADTYVKVSRRLRNEEAVKLFELMMDGPFKLSAIQCTLLLKSLASDVDPDMGLVTRVVNKFEAAGNAITKPIYDGIHRSLCKIGRFDEAHKIVENMKNAGYEPNNITYSQEIHGLCQRKRFEEAWKVIEHMEVEGCVPDHKTWTILIQGYCTAGQVDEALLCLGKMMEKNVKFDADLLQVFVEGFLNQNKLLGAYTFLIEMVKTAHLKPWQATYKLMIEKLLGVGKLEEAYNLLRMMKEHNYPPFPKPFVQYISKSGTVEDAIEFLNALPVKDTPSTSAYVHVIRSFFQEGRHSEAKDLIYKSPRQVRVNKEICSIFGAAAETQVT